MSACVPQKVFSNKDLGYLIPEGEIEKTIKSIGVVERRVADDDVCASDLCYKAALRLLEDNDISPDSIDVLLFMSQTADYRIPATAPLLQHRLGLPFDTAWINLSPRYPTDGVRPRVRRNLLLVTYIQNPSVTFLFCFIHVF